MSPVPRRGVLTGLGTTAVLGVGGCLTQRNDGEGSPTDPNATPTTSPGTQSNGDRIDIDLYNGTDAKATVHVTVTNNEDLVSEHTPEVPPDEWTTVDSQIRDTGEHTVEVDVTDGPADAMTVPIEEYDLENGSNVLVTVLEDEVQFSIED